MNLNIQCPICDSATPESQDRLRELARLGVARFMHLALKAGVSVTPEQQADILNGLLVWDTAGLPGECDFLVHEHANRALWYAAMQGDGDNRLADAAVAMPSWDANAWREGVWNCEAEHRIAERLARDAREV